MGKDGRTKAFEKKSSVPAFEEEEDRERQRHQWYAAVLCFRARRFFLTSPGVRRELESDSNALSVFSISLSRTCFILFLSFIFSRRQTIVAARPGLARDGSPATVFGGRMGTATPMSARRNANNTLSTLSRLNDSNDNKDGAANNRVRRPLFANTTDL